MVDHEHQMCRQFVLSLKTLITANQINNPESFMWFHIPNGQTAGSSKIARIAAGKRDKAIGARAGVADYEFIWRNEYGNQFGFLEAKYGTNGLQENQRLFRDYCDNNDIPFAVFKSVDSGLRILQEWGIIKQGVQI